MKMRDVSVKAPVLKPRFAFAKYFRFAAAGACAVLALSGCNLFYGTEEGGTESASYLVVTTSDYSSGNVCIVNTSDFSARTNLLTVHSDSKVVVDNGVVYILELLGADNIIRADGADIAPDAIDYQQNIGTAVNIHDMAFAGSKAYLTQYGAASVALINPLTGEKTGSIDLSSYCHGGEQVPYMDDAIVAGQNLYVACQRLITKQGAFGPYPDVGDSTGIIVVISTATDQVAATIPLENKNPASMDTSGGFLYVSSTGAWGINDGGIEKINLSNNTNEGTIAGESLFGGDITTLLIVHPTKAYILVGTFDASFNFNTSVACFNPSSVSSAITLAGIDDAFGGMVYDGTYLYIGDRSKESPGIIVVNPADNSIAAGPISTGALPPLSMAIIYE